MSEPKKDQFSIYEGLNCELHKEQDFGTQNQNPLIKMDGPLC